jgi:hypothetical protein
MPETQNATTVTIELPRSNQFTEEALSTMIGRIGERGFLFVKATWKNKVAPLCCKTPITLRWI